MDRARIFDLIRQSPLPISEKWPTKKVTTFHLSAKKDFTYSQWAHIINLVERVLIIAQWEMKMLLDEASGGEAYVRPRVIGRDIGHYCTISGPWAEAFLRTPPSCELAEKFGRRYPQIDSYPFDLTDLPQPGME